MIRLPKGKIVDRVLDTIGKATWDDVTGLPGTDQAGVRSLAVRFQTRRPQVYILTRYKDGGREFSLVSFVGESKSENGKSVTRDQAKLRALWRKVS